MGFQMVPTSMTLNAVIALILHFYTEFDKFSGWLYYIKVVEGRPIMSVKYCLPVNSLPLSAKTIMHPAVRSLCDSWPSCHTWCLERHHVPDEMAFLLRAVALLVGNFHLQNCVDFSLADYRAPKQFESCQLESCRRVQQKVPGTAEHQDCWYKLQ